MPTERELYDLNRDAIADIYRGRVQQFSENGAMMRFLDIAALQKAGREHLEAANAQDNGFFALGELVDL